MKICPGEDLESPRKFICLPPPMSVSSHSSWWGGGGEEVGRRGGGGEGSTLLTHKAHIDKTVKTKFNQLLKIHFFKILFCFL